MPKDVLTEGLVGKFITKVFTSVLKGKQRAILKMVANDPELKKLTQQTQEKTKELHDYLSKKEKERKKTGRYFPDIDY